jgi:hypothetical protein
MCAARAGEDMQNTPHAGAPASIPPRVCLHTNAQSPAILEFISFQSASQEMCRTDGEPWSRFSCAVRCCSPPLTALTCRVRVLTVALTKNNTGSLPLFVRCLCALINLHTLEVTYAHFKVSDPLAGALGRRTFPGIRRLVLGDFAHPLLRACPEAREVVCNRETGEMLIGVIANSCPHVERFDVGLSLYTARSIEGEPGSFTRCTWLSGVV